MLGLLIFVLGCAIPAVILSLLSRPMRDETEDEWMDRIFSPSFDGDSRRQRVPLFAKGGA